MDLGSKTGVAAFVGSGDFSSGSKGFGCGGEIGLVSTVGATEGRTGLGASTGGTGFETNFTSDRDGAGLDGSGGICFAGWAVGAEGYDKSAGFISFWSLEFVLVGSVFAGGSGFGSTFAGVGIFGSSGFGSAFVGVGVFGGSGFGSSTFSLKQYVVRVQIYWGWFQGFELKLLYIQNSRFV